MLDDDFIVDEVFEVRVRQVELRLQDLQRVLTDLWRTFVYASDGRSTTQKGSRTL